MSAACRSCGGITIDQPTPTNTTYLLPVSCPRDGTPLKHVNGNLYAGTEASAICRCPVCGCGWQILVQLRAVPNPALRRGKRRTTREAMA